jgi:glycosyltransferase involved in cell wall biosynthesis
LAGELAGNAREMSPRGRIYFCFADPVGFSGQKAATEIVINGLIARGWQCVRRPQPVLDRSQGGIWPVVRYAGSLLAAWIRALSLLGARGNWLNVNLGQTRMAFVRDVVPLLLGRLGLGRARVVISLHGSPFMRWANESLDARVFRFLLGQAGVVTVLGERQRARLIALGVPAERVMVLVNTCVLEGAGGSAYAQSAMAGRGPVSRSDSEDGGRRAGEPEGRVLRHDSAEHRTALQPVRLLHLSSLIDTKGYAVFLEALLMLSTRSGPKIEAVVCGKITLSEFAERFHDEGTAEAWIESTLAAINRSERVSARWVRGAVGVAKTRLYEEADIFVLPTRYAVEAQPLVLLEAMAAGCAILTTRAGEIETILDERSAKFLEYVSAESVADAIEVLIGDPNVRHRLATEAGERFRTCYSLERHLDAWENLLTATLSKP